MVTLVPPTDGPTNGNALVKPIPEVIGNRKGASTNSCILEVIDRIALPPGTSISGNEEGIGQLIRFGDLYSAAKSEFSPRPPKEQNTPLSRKPSP